MDAYTEAQDIEEYLTSALAEDSLRTSHWYGALDIDAQPPHVVRWLALRGLSDFRRTKRHAARIEMKVTRAEPGFYDRLSRELKERQAARLASNPAARRQYEAQLRKDAQRTAEQDQRMAAACKVVREWQDRVNKALELYEKWTLSDGTPLGDATRGQLLAEAERESASAEGHMKNSRFYASLAGRLEGGQKVGDVIDIADAHRMREEIYTAA